MFKMLLTILLFFSFSSFAFAEEALNYPKTKVLVSTYYAHRWSSIGRYKKVSKNGKRLGNFVALNFLPGGSIVTIPRVFGSTTFEVADTFGGTGIGYYKGKRYWKVDILRNKGEWYDDVDSPMTMFVVKFNDKGPVKNKRVLKNSIQFKQEIIKNTKTSSTEI